MINVFDYENKNVIVKTKNGETYTGFVDWCARAIDIDEDNDLLSIGHTGLFADEIEKIIIVDKPSK